MNTKKATKIEKFMAIKEGVERYCKENGYEFSATPKLITVKDGKAVVTIDEYLTVEGSMRLCTYVNIEAVKASRSIDKCRACGKPCGDITKGEYNFFTCDELKQFRDNDYV